MEHDKKKTVTFDEEEICEYDKDRGKRILIDEPKTPFHYNMNDDKDNPPIRSCSQEASEEGCVVPIENFRFGSVKAGEVSESLIRQKLEELEKQKEKEEHFIKQRKEHYKEFIVAKKIEHKNKEDVIEDGG
eukprot:GHVL01030632.1.p1 GENE.GHVL01030632.1~~GHVL01030632.1.p1  ORF type:complete len:131 (+),score=22.14 GHVL01030632.1:100-492(+)